MVRVAHNRYTHIKNEDIAKMYENGLSSGQIASILNVDRTLVLRRLDESGVEKRKPDTYPELTKELLEDFYIIQKLSSREIAKRIGCSNNLVIKRLKKFGIPIRLNAGDKSFTTVERKAKWGKRLDEHPRWKGGVTAVSGLIRNRLAPISRERFYLDNYKCQVCGTPSGPLHAHHIRRFSDIIADILEENPQINLLDEADRLSFVSICETDKRLLDIDNLITLCESCHGNEHADEYIEPVMWEALEDRWRKYVRENHFTMSIKEMRKVVRARNERIIAFMESENLKYAYDNPDWLSEQMRTKHFTDISREFTCQSKKITASFIESKADEHGLLQKEDNTEIVTLYKQGYTLQDISKVVSLSKPTIRKRLAAEGVDTKIRTFRQDVQFIDVVKMVKQGHTLQSIALEKKCSICKIRDVLKSQGTSITKLKRESSI